MKNAPAIVLFWFGGIALLILTVFLMIAAIELIKRGRETGKKRMLLWGKIGLTLSLVFTVPILFVIGYILYLHIG